MFDVFIMDMGGHDSNVLALQSKFPHARTLRWTDHLHTLRRAMTQCRTRSAWVISSCIDYTGFDWLWEPPPWQAHQVHCWPSGHQQFGDTFLVPREQWASQESGLQRLEQYQDVNFEHHSLPRLPWQHIHYEADTVPQAMANVQCTTPYVWFCNQPAQYLTDAWLWREQPAVSESADNGCCLIPRAAHPYIRQQVYDYRWLKINRHLGPQPLDVVFISNGEVNAEIHYEHLLDVVNQRGKNRVHRINGVNGRVAAYQAAARASQTPWFLAVFAKLQVYEGFDWYWQPDRWQQPKHYIFHARNPVNGLEYGHQAMIAYNRDLVLSNTGRGLDFTLDQPHSVVPLLSGTAWYYDSPWMCWRTAFREVIKLRHSVPDMDTQYRLRKWLAENNADDYVKWSHIGAQDAMEYYDAVGGDFEQLRKSYEWNWLASYALVRRNLVADR